MTGSSFFGPNDAFVFVFIFMRLLCFTLFSHLWFRIITSPFSEICVFFPAKLRLPSSAKRKQCKLSSGKYCIFHIPPLKVNSCHSKAECFTYELKRKYLKVNDDKTGALLLTNICSNNHMNGAHKPKID